MNKQHILDEIIRTAKENGGVPLGFRAFYTETGIKTTDWQGVHWPRWSDATREAGFAPNQMVQAYEEKELLRQLSLLIKEIERYPAKWDYRMKAKRDPGFPADATFLKLGSKSVTAGKLCEYCKEVGNLDDVISICEPFTKPASAKVTAKDTGFVVGYVYLIKAGRYFKIGRSNSVGRREREIALQLPDASKLVHSIKTDDPVGIEAYWHNRFSDFRKNGEWFALGAAEVSVFKRRKFM